MGVWLQFNSGVRDLIIKGAAQLRVPCYVFFSSDELDNMGMVRDTSIRVGRMQIRVSLDRLEVGIAKIHS
jgi:hypothetical protein